MTNNDCCSWFSLQHNLNRRPQPDPEALPAAGAVGGHALEANASATKKKLEQPLSRVSSTTTTEDHRLSSVRSKETSAAASDTVELPREEAKKDHRALHQVAQMLVTWPQDLDLFGLHLGLPQIEIDRAKNNNPNNIEGAAYRLACIWWDHTDESREMKQQVKVQAPGLPVTQTLADLISLLRLLEVCQQHEIDFPAPTYKSHLQILFRPTKLSH